MNVHTRELQIGVVCRNEGGVTMGEGRSYRRNGLLGASTIALVMGSSHAYAQEVPPAEPDSATAAPAGEPDQPSDQSSGDDIVVTGIRASLRSAMNVKRNAQGVVDAISAEDIGKFPDTNLAESLQRITGVSIDRQSGEGSRVTVRGFGPDFNLVLLNGRQMPASGLGSCCEAPASRSFDFANLASEGIAAVEVYKSGRASLPTGGIGSVINIITPRPLNRPGLQGSIGVKGVLDHTFDDTKITPEISGIISKTFADDRVGILVAGAYQRRKASMAQFNAGWREGYLGSDSCDEGAWGGLAATANSWCGSTNNITNRPGPTDTYQTTQNAGYDFTDIDRERINGQLVLQAKPLDSLNATVDYTYSQHTIDARTSSIGVWFNHGNTTSSWTDGPAAGPNFYSEVFGPGKDLAITGAVAANRNTNHSLGGNLEWDGPGGLKLVLDAHRSTAESKPTSPYGSNIAVGSAIFGVQSQKVDFTSDMPVISVNMYPGAEINAANIRPAGNVFRNAYMKDRINELSLKGKYDFDTSFIDSVDFGATLTDNKVRSAYGFLQTDSWGGTLSAAETPDDLYTVIGLPDRLKGMDGSDDPAIIPNYFDVDVVGLIDLLEDRMGICTSPWVGTPQPGTCLATFTTDRRISEETIAPYIQSNHKFDLFDNPANVRLGLRYESTKTHANTTQPLPIGTAWVGDNEIAIIYSKTQFRTEELDGKYDNWLPAIDFDFAPMRDVKMRASYSHTITRPSYGAMQSGLELASPIRVGGSTAGLGNPNLLPYKSKNIDLSAEWYYGRDSYLSVGFFNKKVSNFISSTTFNQTAYNLTNPAAGPRVAEARAALGPGATTEQIRAWIRANYPGVVDPMTGGILGQPNDPLVNFITSQTINSDQKARLWGWEFALQHSFWDTGFGTILNYTIVRSDTQFDNSLRYTVPQFAVTGVSDSANAVLFYDKDGIQARVAYNWRDEFLSGYGFDPFYIEPYGQWDVSASYEFRKGITAFIEGINVTNADRRGHMRNDQTVFFAAPGYARYAAGLRVGF
ncbi:MAG TPA: TonB-dependent receptor [Sphingomicrobium sp.]|nr:TonB-dependent receptor [Sphingomicrobium sp.]